MMMMNNRSAILTRGIMVLVYNEDIEEEGKLLSYFR